MNDKSRSELIANMMKSKTSIQMLKDAIKEIIPQKKQRIHVIVFYFISLLISFLVCYNDNTIKTFANMVEEINVVVIAVFGIVFTGYSLFQALIDSNTINRMLEESENKKTYLQICNEYFLNVMILNIISIIVNLIIILLADSIEWEIVLPISTATNIFISTVTMSIYFLFEFLVMWEMKSFVYNVYQLFNIYACSVAYNKIVKKDNKEK